MATETALHRQGQLSLQLQQPLPLQNVPRHIEVKGIDLWTYPIIEGEEGRTSITIGAGQNPEWVEGNPTEGDKPYYYELVFRPLERKKKVEWSYSRYERIVGRTGGVVFVLTDFVPPAFFNPAYGEAQIIYHRHQQQKKVDQRAGQA